MTALLEVRNVSKSFGGLQALSEVSFTVDAGETLRDHRSERRRQDHPVQLHGGGNVADVG